MKENTKSRGYGVLGTVIFHVLLLGLLLYFTFPKPETPPMDGGGILVQLGTIDEASGTFRPEAEATPADAVEAEIPDNTPDEMLSQDVEESVVINQPEKTEKKTVGKPADQPKPKQEPKDDPKIANRVASAFSSMENSDSSRGTSTTGKGSEGIPNGNSSTGAKSGTPGYGDYDLGGRGLNGALPRPQYDASNDEGTIVVSVTVNSQGRVIRANATPSGSKGTAYANRTLRSRAESAARNAVFSKVSGSENQEGTITYYFKQN